jgi:hypothetical protein
MKTQTSIVRKLEIECMPEDYDEALEHLKREGYVFAGRKSQYVYGQTIYYLTGEKPYIKGDDDE